MTAKIKESKMSMLGHLSQTRGNVKGYEVSNCITGFHREVYDVPKLEIMGVSFVCDFSTDCSIIRHGIRVGKIR